MKRLMLALLVLNLSSCVQVEVTDTSVKPEDAVVGDGKGDGREVASLGMDVAMPAVKNYHQINNTYSQLTGVSTADSDVLSTFNSIKVQLPTTNDPKSINGFNQIAFLRLAFVYCDKYIDARGSELLSKGNEAIVQDLIDEFIYLDAVKNPKDREFKEGLISIINNEDNFLPAGPNMKERASKMVCASLLASAYVTTI